MREVEKSEISPCACVEDVSKYVKFMLFWFYRHLRCFVAKYGLSRFTHICVEKNLSKNVWRKNDKYEVCYRPLYYISTTTAPL